MSTLLISLDDTDNQDSPGTGHLARDIAAILADRFPLLGVTRHQLLDDPRVPMTAKNSANVIHLQVNFLPASRADLSPLADEVAALMAARFQPGSDPGLCLAVAPPPAIAEFGRRTQTELVTAGEAARLADRHHLILRPLGGDGGGIIGALAAVGLASTGNDGRFNWVGQVRELRGVQPVAAILAAGVAQVRSVEGEVLTSGEIETGDKARAALIDGRPVLLVDWIDGQWRAVRRD
jgi:hypothetical protein